MIKTNPLYVILLSCNDIKGAFIPLISRLLYWSIFFLLSYAIFSINILRISAVIVNIYGYLYESLIWYIHMMCINVISIFIILLYLIFICNKCIILNNYIIYWLLIVIYRFFIMASLCLQNWILVTLCYTNYRNISMSGAYINRKLTKMTLIITVS